MAEAAVPRTARGGRAPWARVVPRVRRHKGAVVGTGIVAALGMGGAILAAAALSFIGLGSQPPTPEWGRMLSEGRDYLRDAWWISTFPGMAIMLAVLGVNMLGDGLRDVLDPRLRI